MRRLLAFLITVSMYLIFSLNCILSFSVVYHPVNNVFCLSLFTVAVVVAFFICWAPFHAQRLVYTYGSNKDNKPKGAVLKLIYDIITYVSGILYYVSTTINPILYHIMSLKFREAFKVRTVNAAF